MRARLVAGLVALVTLAACGDSTSPAPFPAMAGTYDVAGTFDGQPDAAWTGTLELEAPSAHGALTGEGTITFTSTGETVSGTVTGTVSRVGEFIVEQRDATGTWRFLGMVDGGEIHGRHVLQADGADELAGSWTAVRQ